MHEDHKRIADMCISCGRSVYGEKAPNEQYAMRAAKLLFMTVAHESNHFQARRQYGLPLFPTCDKLHGLSRNYYIGAFGLWQCEMASMQTSLFWLAVHPIVGQKAQAWLEKQGDKRGIVDREIYDVLHDVQYESGDPLSCILSRVHYLRVKAPIPATISDMAKYAKVYYNTMAGKAKPINYEKAFRKYWPYGD